MKGYISSFQSLGTVDGPGVRAVVFAAGCPLRCGYCHNPETRAEKGEATEAAALARRILRLKPYIKDGGVTFSGGEPLLQAEFFAELAALLKKEGLHIALDTSGAVDGEAADKLLAAVDLAIVDVKFATEEEYRKYTGGSLARTLAFLDKALALGKKVWIRQVVIRGLNDGDADLARLKSLLAPYAGIIERVEFLPFRKLCLEKYERLGLPFPFAAYDETPSAVTDALTRRWRELM